MCITLAIFSLNSFSVYAGADVYPASECVKWRASEPTPELNNSRIFNPSTSWMRVDCPAGRHDFDGFLYTSAVESSYVSAIDRNDNADVCAVLVKYRHTDFTSTASWASGGFRCTTINSGTTLFAEKIHTGSLFLGHPDYHLFFSVWVPGRAGDAKSGLVSFNVSQ
jgi:hypothetical protein